LMYSVVVDSSIGNNANVGPFAHIRQQGSVGESCRVGNFVELKKSTIGDNTNIAHLSYIGDATVGKQVNIGAGTITVNYDGKNKHQTIIGNFTRIGSNNTLVAPLNIGAQVTTAAGSTIVSDVPDDCLAIARSHQTIKPGWRPKWHQD
jgi:bifunctional UDP-N-acetylglucosamine pyrophosphorylase / glucosamine-1-phosphate N-acetyltransferase